MTKVPKRDDLMFPILNFAKERKDSEKSDIFHRSAALKSIIKELDLSKNVLDVTYKKGNSKFENEFGWAIQYLYEAKTLERVNRAFYKITDRGLDLLEENPKRITKETLMQFREFREFLTRDHKEYTEFNGQKRLNDF